MKPKLLSVIVAVYNVKDYISQCIDSICKQTYSNMEIILVDDGSTDGSGEICDDFSIKDPRIKVIHQKNSGVGSARNAGLDIMKGDYLTIVDSDDYVLPETFSAVIEVMEANNLDCCKFGAFRAGSGGKGTGRITLSLEEKHDERLRNCLIHEGTVAWGAVYKNNIWEGIRYPVGHVHEDSVVAHYIIDRIQRCGFIDKEYYYYRKTRTGICQTSALKPKTRYDYILACKNRLDYALQKNICIEQVRSGLIKSILSYLTAFYGTESEKDEYYEKAVDLLREQQKEAYDSSLLNLKYRIYLFCFDRLNIVHQLGAKLSLWSKSFRKT